jgi:hypothetical protein
MSVSPQPTRPGQFGRSFPLDAAWLAKQLDLFSGTARRTYRLD